MRPTAAATLMALSALSVPVGVTSQAGLFRQDGEPRSRQAQIYEMNVRRGVNATLTEWREAWERDDAEAIARLYAENAALYTPEETIRGREAIAEYYRRILPGLAARQATPLHFDASGALAYQIDEVTLTPEGNAGRRTRRQLMVLRQQWDDRWLIESIMASDVVLDATH